MPEGPSIVLLREQAQIFAGRRVLQAQGNAKLDLGRLQGRKVSVFRSWGKHLLIEFADFALRAHLMLFGRCLINERHPSAPRLSLTFDNGELNFYGASIKLLEGSLDELYDWSADVLSDHWDAAAARKKLKTRPAMLACDALLDQDIFSGCGNIIKNEVLYRIRLHPESTIGALPPRKLGELITQARQYSFDFLEWKRAGVLKKHWLAHTKKTCVRCKIPLEFRAELGASKRRAFFCENCQKLYRL